MAKSPARSMAYVLGIALLTVAPVAQPGADTEVPPAVSPALPDLEWAVAATVAVDILGKHEFAGEVRQADLRSARVGGAVLWDRTWAASLGADLTHSGSLGQASIAYFGLPVHLELGRFPEPFGLIQQEGLAGQSLMELPACVVLAPGYGLGLAASVSNNRVSATIGAFAPTPEDDHIQRRPSDESVTMRLTGVPLRTDLSLLHLGAAFALRTPRDEVIQFAALPETTLLKGISTQSAPLGVRRYAVWGAELGIVSGPLFVQAESILARIPLIEGPMSRFHGGYVEGALTLGGLGRNYSTARGVFGPTLADRPLGGGGIGALELTTRYSYLDMKSDELGDFAASEGGPELRELYSGERSEARAWGINWYATDDVKLSFNRLNIQIESRSAVERAAVYQGRVQILFSRP